MDWKDILISQAIATVIAIASDPAGKGKWRKALLKVFKKIAAAYSADAEFQSVLSGK